MIGHLLMIVALGIGADSPTPLAPRLEGTVVDGTHGGVPRPGVEVILRGGVDGALLAVGKAVTDQNGHFVFYDLPIQPGLIYIPGANHHDIHYPGPQLAAQAIVGAAPVKLTVYDAVTAPSPLIAERYDIDIEIQTGVLNITETVLISNPSVTTYVGQSEGGMFATTLSLSIPDGFDQVTFAEEFHGRRFQIINKRVVTDIPWTPGQRELKYSYQLPVEESQSLLERTLDLPAQKVRVRVRGARDKEVRCSLPRVSGSGGDTFVFESSGDRLAAGQRLELQFGQLPMPWIKYARWTAIGLLGGAVLVTMGLRYRRGPGRVSAHFMTGNSQKARADSGRRKKRRAGRRQAASPGLKARR